MSSGRRIFVAGHRGLVGSALVRRLAAEPEVDLLVRSRKELDLLDQRAVRKFFDDERPEQVYLAAAKVGGILANDSRPAEFIHENLVIQSNVIDAAFRFGVRKVAVPGLQLHLSEACAPAHARGLPADGSAGAHKRVVRDRQDCRPEDVPGVPQAAWFRCHLRHADQPLWPGDNFDLTSSHVLPALIRKFVEAVRAGSTKVEIWGTGTPRREFLHVDDLADACVYPDEQLQRCGTGQRRMGRGRLHCGTGCPRGEGRELQGTAEVRCRLAPTARRENCWTPPASSNLGWKPKIRLEDGVRQTVEWYDEQ